MGARRKRLRGYWRIPELTARTKRGEWVVTGDKFVRDSNGYFHYCGRADDMLKISGMWVSPVEVENTLLGHPMWRKQQWWERRTGRPDICRGACRAARRD